MQTQERSYLLPKSFDIPESGVLLSPTRTPETVLVGLFYNPASIYLMLMAVTG